MQFSSRPPYNDDPFPYENFHGTRVAAASTPGGFCSECVTEHDPRPRFDRPQNNPTNPILTNLRMDDRHVEIQWTPDRLAVWLDVETGIHGHHESAHIDHARKVLTRLANLSKVES